MRGRTGGCLGRIAALLFLVVLVMAAWRFGPAVLDRIRSGTPLPEAEPASAELAEDAVDRYLRFQEGDGEEVRFTAPELESLVRFRLGDILPPGVSDPSVRIRDGEVWLGLRVARDRIPSISDMEPIAGILPDTVPVQIRGRLLAIEGGEGALVVHRIDASSIPIPRRFYSRILEAVHSGGRPGLPPEALPFPLPAGTRSIRAEGDHVVLSRAR